MSVLLVIPGLVAVLSLAILKALLVDEVRGRLERHISASVEATIASLPSELAAEWADEWRAEHAAVSKMPVTSARFARGLRRSASQLIGEPACARAGAGADSPRSDRARKHIPRRMRPAQRRQERGGNRQGGLARDRLALLSSSSTALSWRSPSSATTPTAPGPLAGDPEPPSSPSPPASAT